MNLIKKSIEKTVRQYKEYIEIASKALQFLPKEELYIRHSNKRVQLYIKEVDSEGKCKIKYLKKNSPNIQSLLMAKYYRECIHKLTERLRLINTFYTVSLYKDILCDSPVIQIWNSWPEELKCFKPFEEEDESFRKRWEEDPYPRLQPPERENGLTTNKGDVVRSKTERMIANKLFAANIPYRYEAGLQLSDRMVFPDFTLLNPTSRQELRWEHFGMMDDPTYERNAFEKIKLYMASGYWLGRDLILTYEKRNMPLQEEVVDEIIKYFMQKNSL